METNIKNFLKYKNLLFEMIKRDIDKKYKNSFLGILWSIINPLLMMGVLTIVFSKMFSKNIPNFPVYALSGRLLYSFFADATKFSMKSIVQNRSLIKKVYIPKYIFPISKICSTFIIFLISIIPLVGVMLVTGVKIEGRTFMVIIPLIFLLLISTGIGLILSVINVFFRDMEHLYSVVLTFIMYMSAIFYPASKVPQPYLHYMKLNPIYDCIDIFRYYTLHNHSVSVPTMHSYLRIIIYSVVYVVVGIYLFKKNQDKFIFNI